ncbi:rhamnogalacturonan acetylesterase [Pedobacter frigiditerrae]|uniref:rhamnogalacturonan acetylesterase n=1 Tax=Pedobacter frigiditerrae TaxID=2530452 RepID=UPI00292EF4DD|nr:rhamnogalacturonan acetylesterase [Pedobacter frigiditerrae]
MFTKSLLTTILIFVASFAVQTGETTVYIIGDSTAANKEARFFPETGWGMAFQELFNANVKIDNRAANGRSAKTFINEKRWESVLTTLKEGDYVLIQFGHNDQKVEQPALGSSMPEYRANLLKFVKEAQAKKANPVLMTPIVRFWFKDGEFVDSHKGYPDVVRKLADSLHIPLIDMTKKTEKLVKKLGVEPSRALFNFLEPGAHPNYPQGKRDGTHLNVEGAKTVAKLVADGIKEQKLGLAKNLN